jgi:hypothetical protein
MLGALKPLLTLLALPTGCPSVRNRNLAVLPHTAPRLQRLVIGHPDRSAGVRPNVTNEVVLMQLASPHAVCCQLTPAWVFRCVQ